MQRARTQAGQPVLLHCSYGASRAVAAACGYFVWHCHMSLKDALAACKASWPAAAPNTGFVEQLLEWERSAILEGHSTVWCRKVGTALGYHSGVAVL